MNKDILRPNIERTNEIINVVTQLNSNPVSDIQKPHIIGFEEAFDPAVRKLLINRLSQYYPYHSGNLGQLPLNAGSGLLLFSQYPILDIQFFPYNNIMIGEEMLANKGFIVAKLKYSNEYFITVVITHLEAGDAIFKEQQSKLETTSARRGIQMGFIYTKIQTLASTPPSGHEQLKYLKSFVMGDFNAPLNSERQQKSFSTGLSDNGYSEGDVKYPGQYWLFSILKNTIPNNFIETRVLGKSKGQKKDVDPELLNRAIRENKFTGSTFPMALLTNNKNQLRVLTRQETEYKILDGIFCSQKGLDGDLQTKLVSLNELTRYPYQLSDHLTLMGTFTFSS